MWGNYVEMESWSLSLVEILVGNKFNLELSFINHVKKQLSIALTPSRPTKRPQMVILGYV